MPEADCGSPTLRDPLFWGAIAAIVVATMVLALLSGLSLLAHRPELPVLLLSMCIYPAVEEVLFRGGLQAAVLRRCSGRVAGLSLANVVASACFALAHLYAHPPIWALATVLPSLLFGAFYERHAQRLAAPIMLHGIANAAYYVLLV